MRARNNINPYWNINSTYQVFLVLPDLRDLENIEKSSCTRDMLGTRTVFHFNFPRNLVFEKLFHNASLATPDIGESIAFVSSPLRTRVTQTFRTSLYPFSSLVYHPTFCRLHPSIHPSIHLSFPPLSPHRIHLHRGFFAKFHPLPKSREFFHTREESARHRELFPPSIRGSFKKINFEDSREFSRAIITSPDAGTLGKFCVSGRIYRGSHLGAIKSWTSPPCPLLLSMGLTRQRELMWKMTLFLSGEGRSNFSRKVFLFLQSVRIKSSHYFEIH